ncbi:hypothetical protein ScPMuIL_003468 [Solemya velum]
MLTHTLVQSPFHPNSHWFPWFIVVCHDLVDLVLGEFGCEQGWVPDTPVLWALAAVVGVADLDLLSPTRIGRRLIGWLGVYNFILGTIFLLSSIENTESRGRMLEPAQRSSLWRRGYKAPINNDDDGLNCGGMWNQWYVNGGYCGVCGDPWQQTPRENEAGGKYSRGIISRRYPSNENFIKVAVEVTTFLFGYFEFRLCPHNNLQVPVTQDCLDQNLLEIEGHGKSYRPEGPGIVYLQVRIPPGVTCTQCLFQWKWHTGNDWGICSDGTSKMGCGHQEEFYNCADIAIDPVEPNVLATDKNVVEELSTLRPDSIGGLPIVPPQRVFESLPNKAIKETQNAMPNGIPVLVSTCQPGVNCFQTTDTPISVKPIQSELEVLQNKMPMTINSLGNEGIPIDHQRIKEGLLSGVLSVEKLKTFYTIPSSDTTVKTASTQSRQEQGSSTMLNPIVSTSRTDIHKTSTAIMDTNLTTTQEVSENVVVHDPLLCNGLSCDSNTVVFEGSLSFDVAKQETTPKGIAVQSTETPMRETTTTINVERSSGTTKLTQPTPLTPKQETTPRGIAVQSTETSMRETTNTINVERSSGTTKLTQSTSLTPPASQSVTEHLPTEKIVQSIGTTQNVIHTSQTSPIEPFTNRKSTEIRITTQRNEISTTTSSSFVKPSTRINLDSNHSDVVLLHFVGEKVGASKMTKPPVEKTHSTVNTPNNLSLHQETTTEPFSTHQTNPTTLLDRFKSFSDFLTTAANAKKGWTENVTNDQMTKTTEFTLPINNITTDVSHDNGDSALNANTLDYGNLTTTQGSIISNESAVLQNQTEINENRSIEGIPVFMPNLSTTVPDSPNSENINEIGSQNDTRSTVDTVIPPASEIQTDGTNRTGTVDVSNGTSQNITEPTTRVTTEITTSTPYVDSTTVIQSRDVMGTDVEPINTGRSGSFGWEPVNTNVLVASSFNTNEPLHRVSRSLLQSSPTRFGFKQNNIENQSTVSGVIRNGQNDVAVSSVTGFLDSVQSLNGSPVNRPQPSLQDLAAMKDIVSETLTASQPPQKQNKQISTLFASGTLSDGDNRIKSSPNSQPEWVSETKHAATSINHSTKAAGITTATFSGFGPEVTESIKTTTTRDPTTLGSRTEIMPTGNLATSATEGKLLTGVSKAATSSVTSTVNGIRSSPLTEPPTVSRTSTETMRNTTLRLVIDNTTTSQGGITETSQFDRSTTVLEQNGKHETVSDVHSGNILNISPTSTPETSLRTETASVPAYTSKIHLTTFLDSRPIVSKVSQKNVSTNKDDKTEVRHKTPDVYQTTPRKDTTSLTISESRSPSSKVHSKQTVGSIGDSQIKFVSEPTRLPQTYVQPTTVIVNAGNIYLPESQVNSMTTMQQKLERVRTVSLAQTNTAEKKARSETLPQFYTKPVTTQTATSHAAVVPNTETLIRVATELPTSTATPDTTLRPIVPTSTATPDTTLRPVVVDQATTLSTGAPLVKNRVQNVLKSTVTSNSWTTKQPHTESWKPTTSNWVDVNAITIADKHRRWGSDSLAASGGQMWRSVTGTPVPQIWTTKAHAVHHGSRWANRHVDWQRDSNAKTKSAWSQTTPAPVTNTAWPPNQQWGSSKPAFSTVKDPWNPVVSTQPSSWQTSHGNRQWKDQKSINSAWNTQGTGSGIHNQQQWQPVRTAQTPPPKPKPIDPIARQLALRIFKSLGGGATGPESLPLIAGIGAQMLTAVGINPETARDSSGSIMPTLLRVFPELRTSLGAMGKMIGAPRTTSAGVPGGSGQSNVASDPAFRHEFMQMFGIVPTDPTEAGVNPSSGSLPGALSSSASSGIQPQWPVFNSHVRTNHATSQTGPNTQSVGTNSLQGPVPGTGQRRISPSQRAKAAPKNLDQVMDVAMNRIVMEMLGLIPEAPDVPARGARGSGGRMGAQGMAPTAEPPEPSDIMPGVWPPASGLGGTVGGGRGRGSRRPSATNALVNSIVEAFA